MSWERASALSADTVVDAITPRRAPVGGSGGGLAIEGLVGIQHWNVLVEVAARRRRVDEDPSQLVDAVDDDHRPDRHVTLPTGSTQHVRSVVRSTTISRRGTVALVRCSGSAPGAVGG